MALSRRFHGFIRPVLAGTLVLFTGLAGVSGCLNRPLEPSDPRTTSDVQEKLPQSKIKKIDLLLMIDNSASMGDKQAILASAVPDLVRGLVSPLCVDESGVPAKPQPKLPGDGCPGKTFREFDPINDIHVGLISSSLGSRGANGCLADTASTIAKDDHGHLLARSDSSKGSALANQDIPTYGNKGFLAWDPLQKLDPKGIATLGDTSGAPGIVPTLTEMVTGIGQDGCGFESQLESWYRFLVDPEPYKTIAIGKDGRSFLQGVDEELLAERKSFLRPDSLVAIILLTDENDCSINDVGIGFNTAQLGTQKNPVHLPRARAICATNPDDECCKSCGSTAGKCPEDPTCKEALTSEQDPTNLRCFDQKKRFGIDFLYPLDRYTKALSSPTVPDRAGNMVANPLFSKADADVLAPRAADGNLVFLAGIVGVPWQDIARRNSDGKPDLRAGLDANKKVVGGFKNARELDVHDANGKTVWDQILGDPLKKVLASDPLMRESQEPRKGMVPSTVESLAGLDATSPKANTINGHEWDTSKSAAGDLQYACIFPLPTPKTGCMPGTCDCNTDGKNPLCQDEAGNYTDTQFRAKAYPGVRELGVLKEIGDQGIVASVCPAQLDDPDAERGDYGYRPATGAIIDRLKSRLTGECLHRSLQPDANHQVQCLMLEARALPAGETCDCNEPAVKARQDVQGDHEEARRQALEDVVAKAAGWNCFCEIKQLAGDALHACQYDTSRTPKTKSGDPADGWCYIDAASNPPAGDPSLVATCDPTEQRKLRFVGEGQPLDKSTVFITCAGQ